MSQNHKKHRNLTSVSISTRWNILLMLWRILNSSMIFLEDSFEEAGLGLQMEGLRRSHVESRSQEKERTQAGWTHRDTIRQGKWLERHGSAAHGAMPADGGFSATGWGFSLIHCGHPWTKYTGLIFDGVGQLCGVLLWLLYSWNAGSLRTGDKKATKFNEERKAVHFHAIDFYRLFTCLLRVVSFTCDSLFPLLSTSLKYC